MRSPIPFAIAFQYCFVLLSASRYAEQLYEDLLYFYNKNVRPVANASETVNIKFGSALIRIIDVDEVNQVLTTNLWLEMQWFDYKLHWEPEKYGGVRKLQIPSDQIWTPDMLLYNNADGEPHITVMSDALVYYNGFVVWKPPSIYKSFCPIDIKYFPYDSQACEMKFGTWTYNGELCDVRQIPTSYSTIENLRDEDDNEYQYMERGMDLSGFYRSFEWDLLKLSSKRHRRFYPGCCGQEAYVDVTFRIELRRKTLFYTVNLVIPCMFIAMLTTLVFYVPPIEHKMTFSISILVTLTVFYLILIDLIPPTSMHLPLIGKYLLFTMFLVFFSIILSVVSINYFRRSGNEFEMPQWMKVVFIRTMPRYLCMKPAEDDEQSEQGSSISGFSAKLSDAGGALDSRRPSPFFISVPPTIKDGQARLSMLAQTRGLNSDLIRRMIANVSFITEHFKAMKKEDKVSEEWSYVANVVDRLFLIMFSVINLVGTGLIVWNSPIFFDDREPIKMIPAVRPISGDIFEVFPDNFTLESWWLDTGN